LGTKNFILTSNSKPIQNYTHFIKNFCLCHSEFEVVADCERWFFHPSYTHLTWCVSSYATTAWCVTNDWARRNFLMNSVYGITYLKKMKDHLLNARYAR